MASAPRLPWRRLPVADATQLHSSMLFFTLKRHEHGLELQVTDLIHIWIAAKTSKEELKQEAARTRCSIDPTEDEEQYEVLVIKLGDAVSGRDGANVRLVGDTEASTPLRFKIETSIPLPAPLGMLEWTFLMARQESSVFTQELVIPALRVIDVSRRRDEDLRRKIKDKDHVIGKLMDKIEGSGIDLAMVFPGFAGARKGLNARQATEVVPGFKAFRVEDWEGDLKDGDDDGLKAIVDALKDPETGKVRWRGPMPSMRDINGEQHELRTYNFVKETKTDQKRSIHHPAAHGDDSDSTEASSGKPRALRRSSSSGSPPAPIKSRDTSSKPRAIKLGILGGMKSKHIPVTKQKSFSPSPEPIVKASRKLSSASKDTATESESEPTRAVGSSRTATPKKPALKVGIIGGRKPQTTTREKTKSPEPPPEPRPGTPSRGKSRLGAIGGKNAKIASPPPRGNGTAASPTPSLSPGRGTKLPIAETNDTPERSTTPPKEEEPMTEAERANQKRIELKRQLDQGKGKKKKRKF